MKGFSRPLAEDWPVEDLDARAARVEQAVMSRRLRGKGAGPRLRWAAAAAVALLATGFLVLDLVRRPGPGAVVLAGARVEADPSTPYTVAQSDAEVRFALNGPGRMAFDIDPGSGRRWVVDAGLAMVEVLGTRFEVRRRIGEVEVDVLRGRVEVQSVHLEGGRRVLGPGDHLRVRSPPTPPRPSEAGSRVRTAPEAAPSAETSESAAEAESASIADETAPARQQASVGATAPAPRIRRREPVTGKVPAAPAPRRSRTTAAEGEPASGAAEGHGSPGEGARGWVAPPPDAVEILLRRADELRGTGAVEEALELLEVIPRAHPDDPRRSLALFLAARIAQDRGRHASAARLLEQALSIGLVPALREPARARRIEALETAGRIESAREAASDYLRHHPQGPQAATARAVLDQP